MAEFQANIPGANHLNLASKIVLKKKGESIHTQTEKRWESRRNLSQSDWNQHPTPETIWRLLSKLFAAAGRRLILIWLSL
jgi:hypothetical protein